MMNAQPQPQHRWLEKLVGDWTYEHPMEARPGEPPSVVTGTERVRSIGGLWVVAEGQGEMPGGGPSTSVMTLGYDPEKDRFVGTWIGSMMTHLWTYDGSLDEGERVLTLNSQGPSFDGSGKLVSYQDVIEFLDEDRRTLTGRMLTDGGQWQEFMRVEYRRRK